MHVEMLMMSFLDNKIMMWLTSERQMHLICYEKIFVVYLKSRRFGKSTGPSFNYSFIRLHGSIKYQFPCQVSNIVRYIYGVNEI